MRFLNIYAVRRVLVGHPYYCFHVYSVAMLAAKYLHYQFTDISYVYIWMYSTVQCLDTSQQNNILFWFHAIS